MNILLRFLLPLFLLLSCASTATHKLDPKIAVIEELVMPKYEGRGVGTKGLDKARDFLVAYWKERSFSPGFESKEGAHSYTQDFRVFIGNEILPGNHFGASTSNDFIPFAFSPSRKIEAKELVFVGFGMSLRAGDKEAKYDDYENLDVKDKIVVAMLGDPAIHAVNSAFRSPKYFQYSTPLYKVENAELHGAAGIILVRNPLSLESSEEPRLKFQSRQGGGASVGILAGQAKIAYVENVMGASLRTLQTQIAKTQKPASFALKKKIDLEVALSRDVGVVQNIGVLIPGNDEDLAKEFLVIGAHYDHLGFGGDSSMDPNAVGKVHPGADDNASGVQAVLDLASKIRDSKINRRPVLLLLFSGEEIGLLGSKSFMEQLGLPKDANVVSMINLDMVGRLTDRKLTVFGSHSGEGFDKILNQVNEEFAFTLFHGDGGFGSSDHETFLLKKIPSLFFTTGAHPDYHRPTDTADKINVAGLRDVENFVFATWQHIDQLDEAPIFDSTMEDQKVRPRSERGYGAYFGSIPEFGTEPKDPGVLLRGVRDGSPAQKIGLAAGDILTGLGSIKIKNLYDFVFALRFYRPGEEILVDWLRGQSKMQAKVKLQSRE